MRIVCVAGAQPYYMKVKPVMDALEAAGAAVILVHTGQHYDAAMNDVFFAEPGIRPPDHFLQAGSGSHAVQTGKVMAAFEPLAGQLRPDVVVVVGDVNSTLGCALVTAKSGALLAHVEAGLRSRDWDMPEEVNRVVTDRVSDYLFAPSADAVDNLRAEGYRADQIHLAGNVMVDTCWPTWTGRWPRTSCPGSGSAAAGTPWSPCTARRTWTTRRAGHRAVGPGRAGPGVPDRAARAPHGAPISCAATACPDGCR